MCFCSNIDCWQYSLESNMYCILLSTFFKERRLVLLILELLIVFRDLYPWVSWAVRTILHTFDPYLLKFIEFYFNLLNIILIY